MLRLFRLFGIRRVYASHIGDYMRRWIVLFEDGSTVRLHNIMRSDKDDALHDHPFEVWSLVLWRGYDEVVFSGVAGQTFETISHGWLDVIEFFATHAHRVVLRDGPAWTLVFTGPLVRHWGFWVVENGVAAWIPHEQYQSYVLRHQELA